MNQLPRSYTFIENNVIILTTLKTVVQTSNKKSITIVTDFGKPTIYTQVK